MTVLISHFAISSFCDVPVFQLVLWSFLLDIWFFRVKVFWVKVLGSKEGKRRKIEDPHTQKNFISKQGAVAENCRKAGISNAVYLNWRKKLCGIFARRYFAAETA